MFPIFPVILDDVRAHGGAMMVLEGDGPGRVLGFGTLAKSPSALSAHHAWIDVAIHDHFDNQAARIIDSLIDEVRRCSVDHLTACVATVDDGKADWFLHAGFKRSGEIGAVLRHRQQAIPNSQFHRDVSTNT